MATKARSKIQPVKAEQPPVEVVSKPVEVPPAPVSDDTPKQKAIHIASARVRRGLDNEGLNASINKELAPHKAVEHRFAELTACIKEGCIVTMTRPDDAAEGEHKPVVKSSRPLTPEEVTKFTAELATLEPQLPNARKMITALSHEKTRFANQVAPTLAAVCEKIVTELLENSISVIHSSGVKIINVKHLFASNANLPLKQLYQDLPLYKSRKEFFEAEARAKEYKKELEASIAAAKKDWCKEKNISPDAKRKVDNAVKAPKAAPAKAKETAANTESKLTFKVYIGHIIDDLKKEEGNKTVRFSDEVRNFLSDLLIEFIARIATIVHLYIESKKNKTVNAPITMRAVQVLLVNGHSPRETISYKEEMRTDESTKKAGMSAEDVAKLPKTLQLVVEKKKDYPTSGYNELRSYVLDKLREYYKNDAKVDVDKLGL
jgi:histone H3/H4